MQHLPILEMVQRAARSGICPICYQRPPHSEQLPPDHPRTCEPTCTLFLQLPHLLAAMEGGALLICDADDIVNKFACPTCHAAPTAGDFCSEGLARTCPLSRYGENLIAIIEKLLEHRPAAGAG